MKLSLHRLFFACGAGILIGLLRPPQALGQDKGSAAASPGALSLQTERVVVFKDGYGLVVSTATAVVGKDGVVYTDQVPEDAVLGCVWAAFADGSSGKLSARARWVERVERVSRMRSCLTMAELLRANTGRTVTLDLGRDSDPPLLKGKLAGVLQAQVNPPSDARLLHDARRGRDASYTVGYAGGTLVQIDRDKGSVVLPVAQVQRLLGDSLVTQTAESTARAVREKRLEFFVGGDRAGKAVKLRLFWFTPGVRWIPTYRVSGALEKSAHLALTADVENDVGDFDAAEWDLVVGVPNFRFANTRSPLTLEALIRQVERRRGSDEFSNAIQTQQSADTFSPPRGAGSGGVEMAPELTSESSQDLFVYKVPGLSLRKGSRASVPVWEGDVSLQHVYSFDVDPRRNRRAGGGPVRLDQNRIWHLLEMQNASQVPWTTGPALVLRDGVPLCQELLTYTSAGGTLDLPTTVAVDVRGRYEEEETKREDSARVWNRSTYAAITKHATIHLANFKKEAVELRVRASVVGRATNASDKAVVKVGEQESSGWTNRTAEGLNAQSDLQWTIHLDPGATKDLTFDFTYYAR